MVSAKSEPERNSSQDRMLVDRVQSRRGKNRDCLAMILEILKYGAPQLVAKSFPVEAFDEKLATLARDMIETMYEAPGIGLAAPQVGLNWRLIVVDVSGGEEADHLMILVNPAITQSEGSQKGEEGCLSIPGFTAVVPRPSRIQVEAQHLNGEPFSIQAEELLARALCHEIDHLDGILYLDRISPLQRDLTRRKIRKLVKAGEW